MSAYVVEHEVIDRVVTYISLSRNGDQLMAAIGKATKSVITPNSLGAAMLELNQRSVNERYNTADTSEPYRMYAAPSTNVEAYKALRCWIYQSCEGTCGRAPLYKVMEKLSHDWAAEIVRTSPEYEAAEW